MTTTLLTYVDQAKKTSSNAVLTSIIKQVLSAPDVFVFGELLALDSVQELKNGSDSDKSSFALLEIFAFGKYSDYKAKKDSLPALTEKQLTKLKHLSIVALATQSRVIPYSRLLFELDVESLSELENLIIDSMYKDIFVGKLDNAQGHLQVEHAIGRDVRSEDLTHMIVQLKNWQVKSGQLLSQLSDRVKDSQITQREVLQHKQALASSVLEKQKVVQAVMESELSDTTEVNQHLMMQTILHDNYRRGNGRKDKKNRKNH